MRRRHFPLVCLVGVAACGSRQTDPRLILGRWKSDGIDFESLHLPLSPDIEVTRNHLILKSPDGSTLKALELAAIRAERDSISLELRDAGGVALKFTVESDQRIHFRVPFVGTDIAFSKQG